ncbi:hypothetical protein RZS08_15760, partial [Arthrospira platensis SPKY1]|nr:hypothetical protein [Arthrospira platensis SPKY1]
NRPITLFGGGLVQRTIGHGQPGLFQNFLPPDPAAKRKQLVGAENQVQPSIRIERPQLYQRVSGVAGAFAPDFPVVDHDTRQIAERQLAHGQSVGRRGQHTRLVPGLTGGNHVQAIQTQLAQRGLGQASVRQVRRIEGSAEHAHALHRERFHQTQSRRTRNSRYSRSSGVPGRLCRL